MNALESLLLGAVQGLTEFFPVSSSGHLVMLQEMLGVAEDGISFEIVVHVATLASVLLFYRRRVASLLRGVFRFEGAAIRYAGKIAVATLPAVAAVLMFGDFFDAQFESPEVAGICLLLTGFIVWSTRSTIDASRFDEPSWGAAVAIGCAQVLAILPGISRSGVTVAVALALGVKPAAAAEFSFLMSVVAIAGAAVRSLPEIAAVDGAHAAPLLLGGATALITGVAAIWLFVRLLATRRFYRFAYYSWSAGACFLAWLVLRGA